MEQVGTRSQRLKRVRWSARRGRISLAAALVAGLWVSGGPVMAQQPKAPAQKPAPAAPAKEGAKKQSAKKESSWVKLCEDKPTVNEGLAKDVKICLTHHERLSAVNGMVLVSAAIRNVEGAKNEQLMVLVPLGVALPPGLQVRIDENKPIPLKFTFCHVGGCTAEAVATKEVVTQFKKGQKMVVLAINNTGKTVGFPVPLKGFSKAYDGGPVDTAEYQKARRALMKLIQKRQIELAKKAAEAQKQKKKEGAAPAEPKKQQ